MVRKNKTNADYIFLLNSFDETTYLTGAKPHYDIAMGSNSIRYKLMGCVVPVSGKFVCFVNYDGTHYEIVDSNITVVQEQNFVESSRTSPLLLFKFVEKQQSKPAAQCSRSSKQKYGVKLENDGDVFDFVDSSKPKIKRRKIDSSVSSMVPEQPWLDSSYSGRLDLTSAQRRILDSPARWFDDVIINSYAMMCLHDNRYSFVYQDTCLGNRYLLGSFQRVDGRFIQILNIDNCHWICASNALTYVKEPHVVEIFDSLATPSSLNSTKTLNTYISKFVSQLRPMTECIRYVQTQHQGNSSDCGPFSLAFLWALAKGNHPKQYGYNLNGPGIRRKVKDSLQSDRFKPPTIVPPKSVRKTIIKSFYYDQVGKTFQCCDQSGKVFQNSHSSNR